MKRLVIFGAGAIGGAVARLAAAQGIEVLAHTRTEVRHPELLAAGAKPRLGPPTALCPDDALLFSLPGADAQTLGVAALAGLRGGRAVFLSSTAYYGLASGRVDEGTPPGEDERAQRTAAAERAFLGWAEEKGVVLRLGGLYRRGRGPLAALAKSKTVPPGPRDRTLSLIHEEDAALAAFAALQHPAPAPAYLCVVPPCPTRETFYQAACVLLDLPWPKLGLQTKAPPAEYDVARMRRDLLPEPRHPRWQEALVP